MGVTDIVLFQEALQAADKVRGAGGRPGVGKSRLVYEFLHTPRTQGWLLLASRSVSYGKATPYLPVMDLLTG